MTVIRPNRISGVSSITGSGGDISIFRADGTAADVTVNNITSGVITATTFKGAVEGNITGNITGNLSGGTINATSGTITGNLGIGGTLTYEDVTNIDSVGVITARTNINIGDSIIHIGDTNTKIRFPEADAVTIETNGSERLRINSAGSWGIGASFGTTGQVLTSRGNSSSPHWTTPSTQPALMADTWRLITQFINAQTTLGSGGSDWERDDTYGNGLLGTGAASAGMSVSNGYFSFPTTGFYSVRFYGHHSMSYTDGRSIVGYIVYTANNFSSSEYATYYTVNCIGNTCKIIHASSSCEKIFDITDVSNQKFKLAVGYAQNATSGRTTVDTNANRTYVIVTRLGDT